MNCPETGLPLGAPLPPLDLPHFPTRHQAVIWRNWGLITPAVLAKVLGTSESNVADEARRMGLGAGASAETERLWRRRGYITLIRQNWSLLPYAQLLQLLDWTPDRMAYSLKEDDFLWNKLGRYKPDAAPVAWAPLTEEEARRTDELRQWINSAIPENEGAPRARPFDFLKRYGSLHAPVRRERRKSPFGLRFLYSYSAVYGDPLLDPELDPYPDGLLADLAANGINGVWLQGVLYTLVPWFGDTDWSRGHERRIENLNALVRKAARHGIGVYLYLNEPRAMPPEFYAIHPDWKGPFYEPQGLHSMCVSNPEILERLQAGVCDLFRKAPDLAGVFTITLSENLTHCHSKGKGLTPCPRCEGRNTGEIIASVNNSIAAGVHAAQPKADVIAWCWAWMGEWWRDAIDRYRPDIKVMCVSENYLDVESGGVKGMVSDYSMSKVGPAPLAREIWKRAAARGLETIAKVQLNNTWECSAVPYLPVPFLVRQHMRNLEEEGVSGLMAGWTLGGYPGGNLRVIDDEPEQLAVEWFGESAAPEVAAAWRRFGEAFAEFPLNGSSCLYTGPQNYGPMNLLWKDPTGRSATMVGFPYDDLDKWRGRHFPEPVFEEQFRKLSEGWREGLDLLKRAARLVPQDKVANIQDQINVAEAAGCHFRTTYLQIRFIRLRSAAQEPTARAELLRILDEEIALAKTLLAVIRRDSRIGFEASNHYYYTESALKEKVLNCETLKRAL